MSVWPVEFHIRQLTCLLLSARAGVDNRSGFEGENPIATPTYVVNSLGDFHVLA